jgi:hypothetical protein
VHSKEFPYSIDYLKFLALNRFRFGSSFPIQKDCGANYFIGGGDYFKDLVVNMKNAKKEIFVTGWRISPHYLLSVCKKLFKCRETNMGMDLMKFYLTVPRRELKFTF